MSSLSSALTRYRVMAYVVGVWLIILLLIATPLDFAGHPAMAAVVGPIHGVLFIVYLLVAADLARRWRWSLLRMALVMVAGTVPFLSFVMERRVSRDVRAALPPAPGTPTVIVPADH